MNAFIEFFKFLIYNKTALSSILFLLFVTLALFFVTAVQKLLLEWAKKTATDIDDLIVQRITPRGVVLLVIIGFRLFLHTIGVTRPLWFHLVDSFILLYSTIVLVDFTEISLHYVEETLRRDKKKSKYLKQAIYPLLKKIINATYYVISFIIFLYIWGVNVGPFLGGLGIAGLAISFAAKDTLENMISGITLAFDKSFEVGDMISIPEMNVDGVIYDIGLRSTRVLSWDNELFIIPNSRVANAIVQNPIFPELRARSVIQFSVEYGTDVDKVKKIVLGLVKKYPNILEDPAPSVLFKDMGDYGLIFELRVWVSDVRNRFITKRSLLEDMYKAFEKEGIGIPYPTQTLYVHNAYADNKNDSSSLGKKGKSSSKKHSGS